MLKIASLREGSLQMPLRGRRRSGLSEDAPSVDDAVLGGANSARGDGAAAATAGPVAVADAIAAALSDDVPPSPEEAAVGDRLIDQGFLNRSQLAEAQLQQPASGKPLRELLVELGMVDERVIAKSVAEHLGLDFVDFRKVDPDPDAVRKLPEALARSLNAVGVREEGKELLIAVADPLDSSIVDQLRAAINPQPLKLLVAPALDIQRAIDQSYRALTGVTSLVEAYQATDALRRVASEARAVSDDAPVVRMVNLIVTQGLRDRASDVHIEPSSNRVRVRFRIDGALHDVLALPESVGPAIVSRIKIMANMNIVERRRPQDGQMALELDGRPVDIRVATSPTIWGEKAVMRLLDRNRTLLRLDELGMPVDIYEQFSAMLRSPYGMVICAGPTGSGKTTTLYATLGQMNQTERNITTIEDPVEYVFSSINQIPINEQAGVSFANGLRAILRQDPDVILVGEIRDVETARIAVESALTGHFVLTSLHSTDAGSALHRFIDMGIEPFLIASTVTGVVSQRLVRRICEQCKAPYQPSIEELAFYEHCGGRKKLADGSDGAARPIFYNGEGCNFCSRTGYIERVGVFELLPMSHEIKQLVINDASVDEIRAMASRAGMRSLLDSGIRLVDKDITTIGEIMSSVYIL